MEKREREKIRKEELDADHRSREVRRAPHALHVHTPVTRAILKRDFFIILMTVLSVTLPWARRAPEVSTSLISTG